MDEETPSLVKELHNKDGVKVIKIEGMASLAIVASFSTGLVRALVASQRI